MPPLQLSLPLDPSHPEQIEPYLPYEFTCEGMLQRVNAFIENQVRLLDVFKKYRQDVVLTHTY